MTKINIENFLFEARAETYAGNAGKVEAALSGTVQLEFKEGDFLYRDLYYNGKQGFVGMEGIYEGDKPVWAMSYYGHYTGITEQELDSVLRRALMEHQDTRSWKYIEAEYGEYKYICDPDIDGGIEEIGGTEMILKDEKQIYTLYYAGSSLI